VGAQSSTVVIRGMNTDEIEDESTSGDSTRSNRWGAAGINVRCGGNWVGFRFAGNLSVAIAVGISLLVISVLASVSGSTLPFCFG